MRKLLETRTFQGGDRQFVARLYLEVADPTPNYVLDLLDQDGALVQRTYLNSFTAYCLELAHGLNPTDELFSGADGHVKELDKAEAFRLWLQKLESKSDALSR